MQTELSETRSDTGKRSGQMSAGLAAILTLWFATFLPQITAGQSVSFDLAWAPSLGVSAAFLIDGLSLTMALLISGIGAFIFLYASSYMAGHPQARRFMLFLLLFMLSMLGLVLARDLISLFVFWELTSVTSYLLIGFGHESAKARRNALQAMLVTGAGGLALLAGFILMGLAAGSYDLAEILRAGPLSDHASYLPILALILLGAFTKSAQFPFHFWLPGAMAAPTPVSAYLHSATMVKAGVYLLARLHPVLGGTSAWVLALTTAGLITAVWASIMALRQSDLKTALAHTTLMALGTITVLLAADTPYALTAAITFLIVHSLYKAALFMVVGAIDHATGTREISQLGGLGRVMPFTAVAAALAGLSMAGLPPTFGWIGKELIYTGSLLHSPAALVTLGLLLANALMFAVAGIVALRPFWSASLIATGTPHEVDWSMRAGPIVLGVCSLAFGLFAPFVQPLIDSVVLTSFAQEKSAGLHLWAGINLPLGLSLATFALGLGLYAAQDKLRNLIERAARPLPNFDLGWDRLIEALKTFSAAQTAALQNGRLSQYLTATFAVLTATLAVTLLVKQPSIALDLSVTTTVWLIAGFSSAGALLTLTTKSRIANISGLGTVGIGVALIFILFGAPDVATTQLMVETLSAVLFGIAMLRLPGLVERRSRGKQLAHAGLAVAFGISFTLVILAVTAHPLDRQITEYYELNSYSLAHGLNIVNVILVDFRAFDTFGELTVVLLASIGAYSLLKRRSRRLRK